jgi:hypothetical protein
MGMSHGRATKSEEFQKAFILSDDSAGHPIGLGIDNLACLQEACIAPKYGLVHAE